MRIPMTSWRFPVKVLIHKRTGTGTVPVWDRARRTKDKLGNEKYDYYKKNIQRDPPPFRCLKPLGKGKYFLEMYEDEDGDLYPIEESYEAKMPCPVCSGKKKISVIQEDDTKTTEKDCPTCKAKGYIPTIKKEAMQRAVSYWKSQSQKEAMYHFNKPDFMTKYGFIVNMVIMMIGLGIFVYVINMATVQLADQIGSLGSTVAQMADTFKTIPTW